MSDRRPPLDAAAYAAGEGSPDETRAFDARLAEEPDLRREVAFWQRLRPALGPQEVAPMPNLESAILRRALLERRDPRPVRTPRWVAPVAAAAVVLVAIGGWSAARWTEPSTGLVEVLEEPIAFAEDGAGVLPPPADVRWANYMPLASADAIETDRPRRLPEASKPWIGLWTRPTRLLVHGEVRRDAHLVVRVVGGSPAWEAGLRPGDLLLAFNGCCLLTPACLAHALDDCQPGDTVGIRFWSGEQGREVDATLTLEVVHE